MRELARFYATPNSIGLDGGWSPSTQAEADAVQWNVEFKDCHFSYPSDPKLKILNGFSCSIKAGQLVGLCGQTHCGKSTVLRLLERLYDVTEGEIWIGGRPISEYNPTWLRGNIGFIMSVKDTNILQGKTIRENIELGAVMDSLSEQAVAARVREACTMAELTSDIQEFTNGIHTTIGDTGDVNLSDGQTQRLSIARGLIRRPALLLLDEYTSALDGPTETKVRGNIERFIRGGDGGVGSDGASGGGSGGGGSGGSGGGDGGGGGDGSGADADDGTSVNTVGGGGGAGNRVAVIVAHRMRTIDECNQIIYMREGRVVAAGPKSHLIETCKEFADFYHEQVQAEKEDIDES